MHRISEAEKPICTVLVQASGDDALGRRPALRVENNRVRDKPGADPLPSPATARGCCHQNALKKFSAPAAPLLRGPDTGDFMST